MAKNNNNNSNNNSSGLITPYRSGGFGCTFTQLNGIYQNSIDQLDASQKAPVFSDASRITIAAPAGSGKTTVLVDAVASYRRDNVNDTICAVTFTKAAAIERQARLQARGIVDVIVGTIHHWSGLELRRIANEHGLLVEILSDQDVSNILQTIRQDYANTYRRRRRLNLDLVRNYVLSNKKGLDLSDSYRTRLNIIDGQYQLYKQRNHLYDKNDRPLYLNDLLTQYDEYITDVDALFVDEFQDVDPNQLDVFKRVQCRKKFYIGDSWQAIYGFRGCGSQTLEQLATAASGFENYRLKYNYRSYQEIINYAHNFYGKCSAKLDDILTSEGTFLPNSGSILQFDAATRAPTSGITCVRGEGGLVISIDNFGEQHILGRDDDAHPVVSADGDYQETLRAYIKTYRPMFLCRTNKIARALRALGFNNVNTIHGAKGLEYENVLVVDFSFRDEEDRNVAYVALTRAKNTELIINWGLLQAALAISSPFATRW